MARHKKGMAVFFAFALICFFVIVAAAYKVSEQPFFCGICHNMKVYVDSWKASKHRTVACIACHYKPGFMNHLKGKWKDGQLSLVYFITGKGPTKPHAEIDDASCLQSGCHAKSDLKKDIVFKNVVFNHSRHLEQMKRQKQLRCTTCHSQIVQGAHITVTDVECFICHFYKTKDQKEYITGCTSCHFEAKGDIKINDSFDFNHKLYISRNIKCDECHRNVITGDGHIQENSCLKCHNRREILEARYTPEFLHRNHVTGHKIECFECHSEIKHKIVPLHYTGRETGVCAECHKGDLHANKVQMYTGKNAKLVSDHPNRMAVINMDCQVCHQPGQDLAGMNRKCSECHGTLTDGMIERWKKVLKQKTDELQKEIAETKAVPDKDGRKNLTAAIQEATQNYTYLLKGNGVHNIVYAVELVDATKNKLREARAKTQGTTFKPQPFKLSCTYMCHGDILDKKVPFGSVSFLHELHAEGDASCLKCHSPYTNHGKITLNGCNECHHGEGMGKVTCKDCHRVEEKIVRSKGSVHGRLLCTDCHAAIKTGKTDTVATITGNCTKCHKKDLAPTVTEWLSKAKETMARIDNERAVLDKEISSIESKSGKHSVPLRKIFDAIQEDAKLLKSGKIVHNPAFCAELVARTDKNAAILKGMIKETQEGKTIVLK
jgi:hypothetical protein